MNELVNGRYLSNLRLADDTVLISGKMEHLEEMANELREKCGDVSLKINMEKTEVTCYARKCRVV